MRLHHTPFGAPTGTDWTTPVVMDAGDRGFVGGMHEGVGGLVHLGARIYDTMLGRFTSPDPVVGSPYFSQDLNLYEYAHGSPLNVSDATGLDEAPSLPGANDGRATPTAAPIPEPNAENVDVDSAGTTHINFGWSGRGGGTVGASPQSNGRASGAPRAAATTVQDAAQPGGGGGGADADPEIIDLTHLEPMRGPAQAPGASEAPQSGSARVSDSGMHWYDYIDTSHDGALQRLSDFSAGVGDALSFGLGGYARDALGLSGQVNTDSADYSRGEVTGLVGSLLGGGGVALLGRGARAVATAGLRLRRIARLASAGELPAGAVGATTSDGLILIRRGLSEAARRVTLRHELVHRFFTPLGTGAIARARQAFGQMAYNRSGLITFIEEAVAEGYAQRSVIAGLRYPIQEGYVSASRVAVEAVLYIGALYQAGRLGAEIGEELQE